ncbi:hypothetical protein [Kineococcus sp. SYSU DK003]|uniref:hypothetical protein n=1 Tax=Kineococcus sp. SYSU DK003 TaxID=3383124 RepID=UPI003D7E3C3D
MTQLPHLPGPHRTPAPSIAAAGRLEPRDDPGVHPGPGTTTPRPRTVDRLEVLPTPARARHRAPLRGHRPARPTTTHLLLVLAGLAVASAAAAPALPAPLVALGVAAAALVVLPLLGVPLLRLAGLALPDPLARFVLGCAVGLVLLSALDRLAHLAGADPDPLVSTLVVVVLVAAVRLLPGPAPLVLAPALAAGTARRYLPLPALLALPALAWLDVTATPVAPGWLRSAVLLAGLVLLARASLTSRRPHRTSVAAVLYALAVAVLAPFAATGAAQSAVSSLSVVAVWLAAERVLGASRAAVVATLTLAVLVTTPPGPGDLAVTAAVLLVVTGRGERGRRALLGRRLTVLVLALGALLLAPSATVFAAQVCLGAVVTAVLHRSAVPGSRPVLTLPLAAALAVAVWILATAGADVTWATDRVPNAAVVLVALAAAGLLTARFAGPAGDRRSHDAEFRVLAGVGLLVQAAATAGRHASAVPHVLLVLTVPAVLGLAAAWGALAGGLGFVLDRVPGRWLRTGARATGGHRRRPVRATRTALAALALFAAAYGHRAF